MRPPRAAPEIPASPGSGSRCSADTPGSTAGGKADCPKATVFLRPERPWSGHPTAVPAARDATTALTELGAPGGSRKELKRAAAKLPFPWNRERLHRTGERSRYAWHGVHDRGCERSR